MKPSFHLCPVFDIAPPPNGHLHLGSMLSNINSSGVRAPLDGGANVPVPETEMYPKNGPARKDGWVKSLGELRSVNAGIWTKIFGSEGPSFGFLRKRSNEETLTVKHVFVRYFLPSEEYMKKALELDGVSMFVNITNQKKPVYMIIGLMWTVGASLSHEVLNQNSIKGNAGVSEPKSQVGTGVKAEYERNKTLLASFDGSSPFILGIRVRKIWWDKSRVRKTSDDVIGSTLQFGSMTSGETAEGLMWLDDFTIDDSEDESMAENIIVDNSNLVSAEPVVWVVT